ncbi:Peptidase U62 modulator of DNA gyrase [Candidatus Zixiibacteriota bacterium]|nr:Peptidase U62 modulator of DNA gyrase [candidate division Zixibacteria bacterium]
MDREKLAGMALRECRSLGVEYADVRVEKIQDENLSVSDGKVAPIEESQSYGIGIRVIKNGAWGFAATDDVSEKSIEEKAALAVEIAKASALVNKGRITLSPLKAAKGEYVSSYEIDPFTVPLDKKLSFLMNLDSAIAGAGADKINSRNCFAGFRKIDKYFASSDGAEIRQIIIQTGGGLSLGMTKSRRERYERSFPSSSGQYQCKGYELLDELKMEEAIPRLVEEVGMLQNASPCPNKVTTLLLSGDQVSLQIHESIGHPLELDRVFGSERNFSGTSFATPDNLDELKYGASIVTVVSDPTDPHGLGSYGYDDEGVPAAKVELIKDGILVNYLSSRETAARIGKVSTGAMRADGWANVPLVRMTNINLLPGDKTLEEIISGIDDGIFMDTVNSWSIDDQRKYFQMGCEIGWLINGGKLAGPIKSPTYSGCTTDFWNKCTAIAEAKSWKVWGTPNCGKGEPGQNARTGQGASPCRFDNIQVGG